ncbi:MAG: YkgJ family cysteine cluster protein [Candidatus Thiodiazotropha sp.]
MQANPVTRRKPEAVSCATCTAICCRMQVLLIGDSAVPEEMTEWSDWGGQVMRRLDDGWCIAVDRETMRCTIYEQRPGVCRDYEMGGSECIDEVIRAKSKRSV